MNNLTRFFLFCAGTNEAILKRSPTDVNKYAGVGATVFFTGIFAFIAGSFAIHSVFKSVFTAVVFGTIWGLMIFNLDRYIVMSIKKKGNPLKEFLMAAPRLILAILIAFVIAKPLELKLFQSEINAELVLMEQEKYKAQEEALRNRYLPEIDRLQTDIAQLDSRIETKRTQRNSLQNEALKEADGTGGSGNKNLGPIYRAKKKSADNAQVELDNTISEVSPLIESRKAELTDIETQMNTSLQQMKKSNLDGFAAQLDALGNLSQKSTTIFWASLFITLLFIAIETSPVFVKLISSRSPYDYRLDEHESLVANNYRMKVEKLTAETADELQFAKVASRTSSLERLNAEKDIIKTVIDREVEKVKQKGLDWEEYKTMGRYFG